MKKLLSVLILTTSLIGTINSVSATPSYDITVKNNTNKTMAINQSFDWGQWITQDGPVNTEKQIAPGQTYTYHVYNEGTKGVWDNQWFGFTITAPSNLTNNEFKRSDFYIGLNTYNVKDEGRNTYVLENLAGCTGQNHCSIDAYKTCHVYNMGVGNDDSYRDDCLSNEEAWFDNKYSMVYDYQIIDGKPKLFIYRGTNGSATNEWMGEANVEDLQGDKYEPNLATAGFYSN